MDFKTKIIQKRYDGFLNTPSLWKGNRILELVQLDIPSESKQFNATIDDHKRLGKYIEHFVFFQLNTTKATKCIAENIQIKRHKITIGELDCLFEKDNKPFHLEIVYKFYLYDETLGKNEIERFIGPNRKDTLVEKLNKLKNKQLPLLYSKEGLTYLDSIGIHYSNIKQLVCFKAQLFIPFSSKKINFETINEDCIVGFFVTKKELMNFKTSKFYVPSKKDWLLQPYEKVSWVSYSQILSITNEDLKKNFAPLLWIKSPKGTIDKCFLIWWS